MANAKNYYLIPHYALFFNLFLISENSLKECAFPWQQGNKINYTKMIKT